METIKIPPGVVQSPPVDQFHNGMSLTWDQVTEIYEDEERRIHFIGFDSAEHVPDEVLQMMLELGFLDFGFKLILKSHFIFLHYIPGGIKTVREEIAPRVRKCTPGSMFQTMIPIK